MPSSAPSTPPSPQLRIDHAGTGARAFRLGRRTLRLDHQVAVMAIVNRTPDSFFDRGRTFSLDAAVEHALAQVEAGADIVDVGGVKAGPGAHVSEHEERERIVPFVEAFTARCDIPVSVDTFRATVARKVSTDTGMSQRAVKASTNGTMRSRSSCSDTCAPGPALTPPTSTMSAPASTCARACSTAASREKVRPRSKKESGVRLTIAITATW